MATLALAKARIAEKTDFVNILTEERMKQLAIEIPSTETTVCGIVA